MTVFLHFTDSEENSHSGKVFSILMEETKGSGIPFANVCALRGFGKSICDSKNFYEIINLCNFHLLKTFIYA